MMTETVDVQIEKLIHRGYGLARLPDGKAVFIPFTIPGETVRIRIVQEQKSFSWAIPEDIRDSSPDRRQPPCRYFGQCGGCQLMHIDYPTQVRLKEGVLKEIYRSQVSLETRCIPELEFGYRHRIKLQISNDGTRCGFMHRQSNEIIEIEDCLLCVPEIRRAIPWITGALLPKIKELRIPARQLHAIAGTDGPPAFSIQTSHVISRAKLNALRRWSQWPISLGGSEGKDCVRELKFSDRSCLIHPDSFFQANPNMADGISSHQLMKQLSRSRLLELYCGLGFFTVPLARLASRTVAVENNPTSAALFAANMDRNDIQKVNFFQNSVESWFQSHSEELAHLNHLFLDPPRTGLSSTARQALASHPFRRIVYLSCEPATQFRDIEWLRQQGPYELKPPIFFDMFPNTYHIESLALMYAPD